MRLVKSDVRVRRVSMVSLQYVQPGYLPAIADTCTARCLRCLPLDLPPLQRPLVLGLIRLLSRKLRLQTLLRKRICQWHRRHILNGARKWKNIPCPTTQNMLLLMRSVEVTTWDRISFTRRTFIRLGFSQLV